MSLVVFGFYGVLSTDRPAFFASLLAIQIFLSPAHLPLLDIYLIKDQSRTSVLISISDRFIGDEQLNSVTIHADAVHHCMIVTFRGRRTRDARTGAPLGSGTSHAIAHGYPGG